MFDSVVECIVKRKATPGVICGRIAMIILNLLVTVLTILALLTQSFLLAVAFLGLMTSIALTVVVFKKTCVEFEYNYFDDKLRVDKVSNSSSRRTLHTFDVSKIELLAPEGSSHLGGGVNNRVKYDYSVHDNAITSYILVASDEDNDICELKFTPNEEIISAIKRFHSRNVYDN